MPGQVKFTVYQKSLGKKSVLHKVKINKCHKREQINARTDEFREQSFLAVDM